MTTSTSPTIVRDSAGKKAHVRTAAGPDAEHVDTADGWNWYIDPRTGRYFVGVVEGGVDVPVDDERMTRPVSCWRCAAYLPTTRHDDGTVSAARCTCGWAHPKMAVTGGRPHARPIADRPEDEPCEAGTVGCCIDHGAEGMGSCETRVTVPA